MTADQVTTLVRDLGFPIFVAVYMLVRVDKSIRLLTAAVHELRVVIAEKLKAGS